MGNFNEAEKTLNRYAITDSTKLNTGKAYLYAMKGEKEKAFKLYKGNFAPIYSILGKTDKAMKILNEYYENALKQKQSQYLWLKTDNAFDNIRSDPRFQELLAKHKELYDENMRKYGDMDK